MNQVNIVTIVGARPQFIKAAVVSRALSELGSRVRETIVHTGQHFDKNMSDVFFEELDIPKPNHHLGIGGGTHGQNTGRMIEAIEAVLLNVRPDWVLVYGDTDSTVAGALAAVKLHIPVAHVEAGLRSFNRRMPEEMNRVLTDHMSELLFTPTESANRNLEREGITGSQVRSVGDVMFDACLYYRERAREPDWFKTLKIEQGAFVLATVHRQENTDNPAHLQAILQALSAGGRPVILPIHPRTSIRIASLDLATLPGLHVVPPVSYLEMVWLEMHCALVATDSGGVQKEAYFHGKRCITLRNETEWRELIEIGANVLVGTDRQQIMRALSEPPANLDVKELYGNGTAAEKIANLIQLHSTGL
jgi:UDP-GlcNAc3NAcA epimerase